MKRILLLLTLISSLSSAHAQSVISIDGGVAAKSVSRATKKLNGKDIPSSRIIIESKLNLDFAISNDDLIADPIDVTKLLSGLYQYTIFLYNLKPGNQVDIEISSLGYHSHTIADIPLTPKQTHRYYIYDPLFEKKTTRILKQRRESQYLKAANALYNSGHYDESIAQFNKAIEANIMCDSAYYGKALALKQQKKYKEAVKNYLLALDRNIEFTEIYDDLRKMHTNEAYLNPKSSIGKFAELPLYELAFRPAGMVKYSYTDYGTIDPTYSNDLIFLGSISEPTFAIECYRKALREDSDNIHAYFMLGYTYMRFLGDYDNAYIAFRNLVDRSHELSEAVCEQIYAKWKPKGLSSNSLKRVRLKYINDGHVQEAFDFLTYAKSKQPKSEYSNYLKIYKELIKEYLQPSSSKKK